MGINKDSEMRRRERNRYAQIRRERNAADTRPVTLPPVVSTIKDGEWAGQACFIIGGGASLKGFDFERLRGKGRIISINRAFEFIPFADIHFFMDYRYYDGPYGVKSNGKWTSYNGRHVFLNVSNYPAPSGIITIKATDRSSWPKSITEGLRHGNNSGTGAINLAFIMGANPIYLLGFDCKRINDATHFHNGYKNLTSDKVLDGFAENLNEIAPIIKDTGVKVINLYNPEAKTALAGFDLKAIDEIIPPSSEVAYFDGALGFGDNIYQRSILRHFAKRLKTLYLRTTCPDLYWDIPNIRFVNPGLTRLRTQNKYLATLPKEIWSDKPVDVRHLSWRYRPILHNATRPECDLLRESARVSKDEFDFSFPVKPEWIEAARAILANLNLNGKKLCLIRPSTIRKEWLNPARNPKNEYYQLLIDRYKDEYFYLSFADIKPGEEWLEGELQGIDVAFHKGEFPITTIFGLIKISDMIITNPAWVMLAGIAERVRCFTIFGGMAPPSTIIDPSMGLDAFAYVAPEPFCACWKGDHGCNKNIPSDKIIGSFDELKNRPIQKAEEKPIRWESLNRIATTDPPPADPIQPKAGTALFFQAGYGLGDNLWQRPVIKNLAEKYDTLYLKTSMPEFFWDIHNIRFVYPDDIDAGCGHRALSKRLATLSKGSFSDKPQNIQEMRWCHKLQRIEQKDGSLKYYIEDQAGNANEVPKPDPELSIYEDIRVRAGIPIEKDSFLLPVKREWIDTARKLIESLDLKGKKLCLINPPTIRAEWQCVSRNPKAEYFQMLIDRYKDEYFFISVADLEGGEKLDGILTGVDLVYHQGELPIATIAGLLKIADMTITPPAWMMMMAISIRAKAFVIFGGHAGPEYLLDKNMGLDNIEWAAPNPSCNCFRMNHECNKIIPEEQIINKIEALKNRPKVLKTVTVGFPPGLGDVHWPALVLESFKEKHGVDKLIARFYEQWDYTSTFMKHVPFVDEVEMVKESLPFSFHLAGGHGQPLYINKGGVDFMMEYGSSLERGVPFEQILPQYKTNWEYPISGLDDHDEFVSELRERAGDRLVVIFTASLGGNQAWCKSDWTVDDWMELIKRFHQANGCKVVMVGMDFDKNYTNLLMARDKDRIIIDLTGQTPIMKTLAILRGADLFVAFSCGLGMLSAHFRVPTAIFWPIRGISKGGVYGEGFMTSWLPPWFKNTDAYLPIPYGPESRPERIAERLKKYL